MQHHTSSTNDRRSSTIWCRLPNAGRLDMNQIDIFTQVANSGIWAISPAPSGRDPDPVFRHQGRNDGPL